MYRTCILARLERLFRLVVGVQTFLLRYLFNINDWMIIWGPFTAFVIKLLMSVDNPNMSLT